MDRRHTAIHEAGHAVIARVLDLACGGATIVPDATSAGHAITADPITIVSSWIDRGIWRGDMEGAAMRGRCISCMAGAEAEEVCLGVCHGGDGNDRYQIDLMLDSFLPADADVPRYAKRLRSMTRWLVRRHRPAIERVANLLLERGQLEPAEINHAIRELADDV
jgi:ATP-dependent Zn protease